MTVKELIEQLSQFPRDAEVKIEDSTGWEQDIATINKYDGRVVIDLVPR